MKDRAGAEIVSPQPVLLGQNVERQEQPFEQIERKEMGPVLANVIELPFQRIRSGVDRRVETFKQCQSNRAERRLGGEKPLQPFDQQNVRRLSLQIVIIE